MIRQKNRMQLNIILQKRLFSFFLASRTWIGCANASQMSVWTMRFPSNALIIWIFNFPRLSINTSTIQSFVSSIRCRIEIICVSKMRLSTSKSQPYNVRVSYTCVSQPFLCLYPFMSPRNELIPSTQINIPWPKKTVFFSTGRSFSRILSWLEPF